MEPGENRAVEPAKDASLGAAAAGAESADVRDLATAGWPTAFSTQLGALVRKNMWTMRRHKVHVCVTTLSAPVFVLLLWWLASEVKSAVSDGAGPISTEFTPCARFDASLEPELDRSTCVDIVYAPTGETHDRVMSAVAEGLDLGAPSTTDGRVRGFATVDDMARFIFDNPGAADIAIHLPAEYGATGGTADMADALEAALQRAMDPFNDDGEVGQPRPVYDYDQDDYWGNGYGGYGGNGGGAYGNGYGYWTPDPWDLEELVGVAVTDIIGDLAGDGRVLSAEMWFNETANEGYRRLHGDTLRVGTSRSLGVQAMLEAAMVQEAAIAEGVASPGAPRGTISLARAPAFHPLGSFAGIDETDLILNFIANLFMVTGAAIVALMQLYMVVREKQVRLLGALRAMGVYDSSHWLSWFIAFAAPAVVAGCLAAAVSQATDLVVFTHVDASVHVILLSALALAFSAVTIMLAAVVTQPRWVNAGAFLFFSITFIVQNMLTTANVFAVAYEPDTSAALAGFLFLLPGFHYGSSIMGILTALLSQVADDPDDAPSVGWDVLVLRRNATNAEWDPRAVDAVPSVLESLFYLLSLCVIYLIMAWYFGQVSTDDLGVSQPFYFPLLPEYWGFQRAKPVHEDGDTLRELQAESARNNNVVVHKLSKSYKTTRALRELSIKLADGELTVVLGQNGSGKTTLCNVLSGLLQPSHGHAYLFGLDLQTDVSLLRQRVGKMDQAEVLWGELSAEQHLWLFCALKGVKPSAIERHVADRLRLVGLGSKRSVPVSTFSGGMQRRLSVVMASCGAPKLVFLDEPTTGLDPLSRRRVWRLIRALKANRIVLLTTHDLAEADALGDTVAVLHEGRLRAVGTPTFLRSRFGSGFQLSVLTSAKRAPPLRKLIMAKIPGSEVVGDAAGNLTVAIPRASAAAIPRLLRALGSSRTDAGSGTRRKPLAREWSIRLSGLEEVFLRLAGTSTAVNAPVGGVDAFATTTSEGNGTGGVSHTKLCALCKSRPHVPVSVYNKGGVEIRLPDVLCAQCALVEGAGDGDAIADGEDISLDDAFGDESGTEADAFTALGPGETATGVSAAPGFVSVPTEPAAAQHPQSGQVSPPSTIRQVRAVLAMRKALAVREKKSNCCIIFLLLISLILSLLMGLLSGEGDGVRSGRETRLRCPGGWYSLQSNKSCEFDHFAEHMTVSESAVRRTTYTIPPVCLYALRGAFKWIIEKSQSEYISGDEIERVYWATNLTEACGLPEGLRRDAAPAPNWWSVANEEWDATDSEVEGKLRFWLTVDAAADRHFVDDPTNLLGPSTVQEDCGGDAASLCSRRWFSSLLMAFERPSGSGNLETAIEDGLANLAEPSSEHWGPDTDGDGQVDGCQSQWGGDEFQQSATRWHETSQLAAVTAIRENVPDAGIHVSELSVSDFQMAYDVHLYDRGYWWSNVLVQTASYCWWQGFGAAWDYDPSGVVSGMSTALLRAALGDADDANSRERVVATRFRQMPVRVFEQRGDRDGGMHSIMLPLLTMLLIPRLVGSLASEKEQRLVSLMHAQGLRPASWWLGNYLFQFLFFLALALIYVLFGLAVGAFGSTGWQPLIALLVAWGHAQVGLAFFMAALSPKARLGTPLSYVVCMLSILAGLLMSEALNVWPSEVLWFPPLAYMRATWLTFAVTTDSIPPDSELADALLAMFLSGTIGCCVGAWLYEVIPGAVYSPRHPLFCCGENGRNIGDEMARCARTVCAAGRLRVADLSRRRRHAARSMQPARDGVELADAARLVDENVDAEAAFVHSEASKSSAVLIKDLNKTFFPSGRIEPVRAVRDLNLAIQYGTCFGLLGPNGAGKTTALSQVMGVLDSDSGSIAVAGFDVISARDIVHRVLGVTPQFTACWDELSVADHLRFFAGLKGIPSEDLRVRVQQAAERVNLDGDAFNQRAVELSGGMRRRMALGIALVNSPPVLLLDEPTTGLDPESKRMIWEIVQREKAGGRCIILSTHAMEEAETLCSRIGIMARGSLRVVGTQGTLKARFGDGYTLSMSLASGDAASRGRAAQLVLRHASADSVLTVSKAHGGRTVTVQLPNSLDVPSLFETMLSSASVAGVEDWALNPSSLDDVFVAVARAAEAEAGEGLDEEDEVGAAAAFMGRTDGSAVATRSKAPDRSVSSRALGAHVHTLGEVASMADGARELK